MSNFYTNDRETTFISKLENFRQMTWESQLSKINIGSYKLSQRLSMKLVDLGIIETTSIRSLENQILYILNRLLKSTESNIQNIISHMRNIVERPNKISLYITIAISEELINDKSIVDIYGTDKEIYEAINLEINKFLS